MYVVGSTGMGKSEFLKNMAIQDIEAGHGVAFIDPHGDSADALLDHIPQHRIKDIVYFDPGDLEFPIAFNVMEGIGFDYRHLVASGLLAVFKKLWVDAWSGRMEYILNHTILALLETEGATLLSINRMMADKVFRKQVVAQLKDPIVKAFWTDEFAKYADKFATEATAAIQNKVGQFGSNNVIRNIVGQVKSKIDIRKIMDEGKILIVNLSKGGIGEDASRLIGNLLVTKIQLAAMSRVDIPENQRRDFFLYVDEFQNFATESFASILSEARKFHLSLVVAHQYIKQMEEPVRDAVFGNVGTIVSFRVGAEDAEFLEKWFQPDFMMNDIVNLGKYNVYLKLMIDGISSKGFSATMLPPFPKMERNYRSEVIDYSRSNYANLRATVESSISEWALSDTKDENNLKKDHPPRDDLRPQRDDFRPQRDDFRPRRDDGPQRPQQRSFDRPQYQNQGPRYDQPPRDYRREEPRDDRTRDIRRDFPIQSAPPRPMEERRPLPEERPVEARPPQAQPVVQRQTPVQPPVQLPVQPRPSIQQPAQPQPPIQPRPSIQPPVQQPKPQPTPPESPGYQSQSLAEVFKSGPVNFRGKKLDDKQRPQKDKKEVNTDELRKILEGMGKKE